MRPNASLNFLGASQPNSAPPSRDPKLCPAPRLNRSHTILQLNMHAYRSNGTFFPHGTTLTVKCTDYDDQRDRAQQWRCRRGKWETGQRIDCPQGARMPGTL